MTQGIYGIRCLANSRVYVGQSKKILSRWRSHKRELLKGTHHNDHLQNAWNKYRAADFVFFVCEVVPQEEHLIEREVYWYKHFKTGDGVFNEVVPNRQPRGHEMKPWNKGGHHTEETKRKISEGVKMYNATPEGKVKIAMWQERMKGRSLDAEARQRISEKRKAYCASPAGRAEIAARPYPRPLSDKCLVAMRASHSPLTQEDVLDIRKHYAKGNITQVALADIYNVHNTTIHCIVQNKTWKRIIT